MIYFACLGLGFLGIEMALIERFSFWLESTTTAFSAILSGMLIFSGVGSALSGRFMSFPKRGVRIAGLVVLPLCALFAFSLPLLFSVTGLWPFTARLALALGAVAPISLAMGAFMPLGLHRFGDVEAAFLPWAWGINGAFSVIATPLASLVAMTVGYGWLFAGAAALYALAVFVMPPDNIASKLG